MSNTSESLPDKLSNANDVEINDIKINDDLMAAIDIGSNSFHLAIARLDHGEVRKVASMSEKVQLAAGLDDNDILSLEAQQRGLDCLTRFMGRLESVPEHRLRIVATNALRKAKNADAFIKKADNILSKPIEVIAGREEARLIYLGVSHTNASIDKRLVIDIGGGSTEFIIGEQFEPILTESLQMGCVAFTQDFFADGHINETALSQARTAARKQLLAISKKYKKAGWSSVIGSSGTIKAVWKVLIAKGWADEQQRITYAGLQKLEQLLIEIAHVDNINLEGVKEHRTAVFPAGVAVLSAIMQELNIDSLAYSDGALREGVMYDMLGRFASEDVRDRSVQALMTRYSVDKAQAKRVVNTSKQLLQQVEKQLNFSSEDSDLLRRAAYLHEIGMAVSHSSYHKHSAYLLEHSDIPGFSKIDQKRMALLVLSHRRKLKTEVYEDAKEKGGHTLLNLSLLLRLAARINHSRSDSITVENCPIQLNILENKNWQLTLQANRSILQTNEFNLLYADLQEEKGFFAKWQIDLSILITETDSTP